MNKASGTTFLLAEGVQIGDGRPLYSWAQVNLGVELHGVISSVDGRRFLEADINQPKLKESGVLATSLARMIEKAFSINDLSVQSRIRYVECGAEKVMLQIHLMVEGQKCPDQARLIEVFGGFSDRLVMTADMYKEKLDLSIDEIDSSLVRQAADEFLRACGGKPISRSMQLVVDETPVATLAGIWRPGPKLELIAPEVVVLEAMYDGRRLRARTLFVLVMSPRAKSIEIYYDEEKFDTPLRGLSEDKHVMLSLTVRATSSDSQQIRYELLSFERIKAPSELMLA
ncbi:MAG: hypothetical protein KGZ70_10435 [Hydrogenophaga sp.]|nr:hypothetical protein [Hydrogenophaga sp.]